MRDAYNVYFALGRTALVIEADLRNGWGERQKTYGFFRQMRVPYRRDLIIRAQLSVIAQPASFADWAHDFPDLELDEGDDNLRYAICDKRLKVTIALSTDQPWRTTEQGRPEIYIEALPLLRTGSNRWYDLRAWVIFHESPMRPIPDARVWAESKLILPSHFESNRRRH